MSTYENNIYLNHILDSENSEDLAHLYSDEDYNFKGGAKDNEDSSENTEDRPTGGFPPIFIIDSKQEKEADKTKNRQISANKSTVSIMDILKSKKK